MNDKARELLVKAALDRVPQCRGVLFYGKARCAMGAIAEGLGMKEEYLQWGGSFGIGWWPRFLAAAGISPEERDEIVEMNDTKGWDFLTIARKAGVREEEAHG